MPSTRRLHDQLDRDVRICERKHSAVKVRPSISHNPNGRRLRPRLGKELEPARHEVVVAAAEPRHAAERAPDLDHDGALAQQRRLRHRTAVVAHPDVGRADVVEVRRAAAAGGLAELDVADVDADGALEDLLEEEVEVLPVS